MKYKSFHYYLIEHFSPDLVVLELGSGVGSEILKSYFKEVYSVEEDSKFLNLIVGVTYLYVPIKKGWYSNKELKQLISGVNYDLLIIDGPKGSQPRSKLAMYFDLFKENVPWIFDDVNRKVEYRVAKKFANRVRRPLQVFDSIDKKFAVV